VGWVAGQAASGGPSTRDGVVNALHGQTHTGKNAVTPLVFQYEDFGDLPPASSYSAFPEWEYAVNNNNWYTYQYGSSGTKAINGGFSSWYVVDAAHVVGADSATGLYPYGLATQLMYQRYYLGTGSEGPAMASTHLDGYYMDAYTQYNQWGPGPADFLRNGSSPAKTDPTSTAATLFGKADYPNELNSLNSSILVGANAEFGYSFANPDQGGLGMTQPNSLSYRLNAAMDQFLFCSTDANTNCALNFISFADAIAWEQETEANLASGGMALETGIVDANDYQTLRYSLAFVLMRNGWYVAGVTSSGLADFINPGNLTTYPVFDEFWGGTLNLAGYLGAPAWTSQGAEQTVPWSQGVWRRDFANWIVLANPAGNGWQTVALGGTYYHLRGSQAPSINNGQAVTGVTIPPGDGLILLDTAPP